ncbi:unnamed protein product, partial [Tilletia controversa]
LIRRAAPPRSCALEATTSTPEGGHSAILCAVAPVRHLVAGICARPHAAPVPRQI